MQSILENIDFSPKAFPTLSIKKFGTTWLWSARRWIYAEIRRGFPEKCKVNSIGRPARFSMGQHGRDPHAPLAKASVSGL